MKSMKQEGKSEEKEKEEEEQIISDEEKQEEFEYIKNRLTRSS